MQSGNRCNWHGVEIAKSNSELQQALQTGRRPIGHLRQQAQALIAAIDRGGLPLNPARINHIARSLGLDVSPRAPMEQTVERIRQALARGG